ncbi:MAG TPA: type II toxin-antitoxin system PemK/MazF family toxin [Blastocatellia bacterium]|nr:type II toxin-antitoxin system PemK/MazF family toxin [Blastocatellia bacterium]
MTSVQPSRGEIWFVNLDPTKGRELAGSRPAIVLSVDPFNHGPADLVVVIPVTSKAKGIPFHVAVRPPEGGLKQESFIKCEDVRSISKERLLRRLGMVSNQTMEEVEDRVRILLGL